MGGSVGDALCRCLRLSLLSLLHAVVMVCHQIYSGPQLTIFYGAKSGFAKRAAI